jgi:hypothetical protein
VRHTFAVLGAALAACSAAPDLPDLASADLLDAATADAPLLPVVPQVAAGPPFTVAGVGAGQALEWRDGLLWVAGDADTGVLRAFTVDLAARTVQDAGITLALTVAGQDQVPHPTGLTHHPDHGTFLGNTVGGVGTLRVIDWSALRGGGTLDGAVLATVDDDLAANGTRPELVRLGTRWLLATADYGDTGNALRLYDPDVLTTVARTSQPGVLQASLPAPPLVQSLRWLDDRGLLVLVQNTASGNGWRLTWVDLQRSLDQGTLAVDCSRSGRGAGPHEQQPGQPPLPHPHLALGCGRGWYGSRRLTSSGRILTYRNTLRFGPAGALGGCRTIHGLETGVKTDLPKTDLR